MDRLLMMDRQEYVSRMQVECRRIMEQVADAVNAAPTGNVISGSEMQVRDLMAELRRKAFEMAVQMRVDSSESTFSPSERRDGQAQDKQGDSPAQHFERQRADRTVASAVREQRTGK
jgi:hypothetical protein